jgi:drug/metabolite transporter (DMT)-like permease
MLLPGILTGLICASAHSFCYLASKHHAVRHPGRSLYLLLYGHLLMAIVALPLTLFLLPEVWPPRLPMLGTLLGSTVFYGSGQGFMIAAMHHSEPSRVSPLLGVKVLLMGVLASTAFGTILSSQQWIALVLCTLGAVSLGISGGVLPFRAALYILLAATSYVLSDSCIEHLVSLFHESGLPLLHAALFALGLTYTLLAVLTLIATPKLGGIRTVTRYTRDVAPFAAFWITAMGFYYLTLGLVGPVFGVVLQSTRGILSIFLAAILLRLNRGQQLEQTHSPTVFLQRLAAAILMFSAIALYATG